MRFLVRCAVIRPSFHPFCYKLSHFVRFVRSPVRPSTPPQASVVRNETNKQQTKQTMRLIDDVALAKEMNELLVEEREKVFDDIHGGVNVFEETPAFVKERIQELDAFILKLPARRHKFL
jgi:hypothetical protein